MNYFWAALVLIIVLVLIIITLAVFLYMEMYQCTLSQALSLLLGF